MHVLIIKISSMGDVIHTLPALTDAVTAIPHCTFDWVIEPAFAEIPAWHPAVQDIILLPLRQWRKNWRHALQSRDIQKFYQTLSRKKYDAIIDAQGLLKSAVISKLASGVSHGFDKHSARESISGYTYKHKHSVNKQQHAVTRIRELFAKALNYPIPRTEPNYGIDLTQLPAININISKKYCVFLHGTTWDTKHYSNEYWNQLIQYAKNAGIIVYLPWGNEIEKKRAQSLAVNHQNCHVLPKLSITEIAAILKQAAGVIAVDTGLGHLCAVLGTPTVSLYGPTNPMRAGTLGQNQAQLATSVACAPCLKKQCAYEKKLACLKTITPDKVWKKLQEIMHA